MYPEIYAKLGKVSIGTLQRWKRNLGNSNNYELLIPNYHYEDYSRTCLTDYEKQIFLKEKTMPVYKKENGDYYYRFQLKNGVKVPSECVM